MAKQANAVHALTVKHNDIHYARWREAQVPLAEEKLTRLKTTLEAMDSLEAEVVAEQRAAAQPQRRRYQLIPEKN